MVAGAAGGSTGMVNRLETKSCQQNLKQLGLAMMQYLQDYDEKLPPARQWCDDLEPYLKNAKTFHCPAVGSPAFGYAMNSQLSRKHIASVQSLAETVLLYDSRQQPKNAFGTGSDVSFRHDGLANYLFADGHVQAWPPSQPQNFRLEPAKSNRYQIK